MSLVSGFRPGLPPSRDITQSMPLVPRPKPVCKQSDVYRLSPREKVFEVEAQAKLASEKAPGVDGAHCAGEHQTCPFVPKKAGGLGLCVDCRASNRAAVGKKHPPAWPTPKISLMACPGIQALLH